MHKAKVLQKNYKEIPVIYIVGNMTSETDESIIKSYKDIKNKDKVKNLIINFEKTEYINSAGIATLINIIKDMHESSGKVFLSSLSTHFEKIMNIVGISEFVKIFNDNEDVYNELNREIEIP